MSSNNLQDKLIELSLAGSALCLTVISLFVVNDKHDKYVADELFTVTNFIFLAAAMGACANTKFKSQQLGTLTYAGFVTGLGFLLASSLMMFLLY